MSSHQAGWTVLLFMNADANGLEDAAFATLRELAGIGSTPRLNIVAQVDLREQPLQRDAWAGARRFYVTKDMAASESSALPGFDGIVNSGDGRVLADFVKWGMHAYPADRTMLVIWGHGRGYDAFRDLAPAHASYMDAATEDETAEDPLYVREAQDALTALLAEERLDIIGFDSCLMGMVEVAYAMRDVAHIMLGSQEIERDSGWTYRWLAKLQYPKRDLDEAEVAHLIVDAHRPDGSGVCPVDTIGALRVDRIHAVARAIDEFAIAAFQSGKAGRNAVIAAREKCSAFGGRVRPSFSHAIDLRRFLQCLESMPGPKILKRKAAELLDVVDELVLAYSAAPDWACPNFCAQGVGIYYPLTIDLMGMDPFRQSYLGSQAGKCVQFSEDHRWLDYLHWALPTGEERDRLAEVAEQPSTSVRVPNRGDLTMRTTRLDELTQQTRGLSASSTAVRDLSPLRRQRGLDAAPLAPHPSVLAPWKDIVSFLDWVGSESNDPAMIDAAMLFKQFGARARAGLMY